ncbi:hypothetical protein H6771_00750 [Candidatus Peribacteria bacterium]|nr:hypothetical protein [Candidatus Peribacteria bacterium]
MNYRWIISNPLVSIATPPKKDLLKFLGMKHMGGDMTTALKEGYKWNLVGECPPGTLQGIAFFLVHVCCLPLFTLNEPPIYALYKGPHFREIDKIEKEKGIRKEEAKKKWEKWYNKTEPHS